MYAYGVAKLPVSTSSLLIASQLVFMAGFAYVLVKQKLTPYSLNGVVLLTVGAVILGLNTGSDRPKGESNKMYWLGFILTMLAAVMYGLILPLVELVYKKAKQEMTYTLVMEFQTVMGFFATAFCTVGMIVNKDFQVCTFGCCLLLQFTPLSHRITFFKAGKIQFFLINKSFQNTPNTPFL